ncbi:unnamed protein product [Caenorhabditis bovis]|uniref:Probable ATP-dependent RNA helicase DDX52 n=1 Tax=Caenorhabditis bovis TaxID=2654633 RepID=A0A8S1F5R9_9PELO|nr:unnamed protein product [Caenorhabditis bovis]
MTSILQKLTFGVKKAKPKQIVEERRELSNISEDAIRKFDEIREKMIGKVLNVKPERKKKSKKQEAVHVFSQNRKRRHDSDNESECETEENYEKELKKLLDDVRRANRIFTWGDEIPDVILRFSDANVDEKITQKLDVNNIKKPSPIQMQSIPLMLHRRNILASAPTGSGKTLAFAIPIIDEILKLKQCAEYSGAPKLLAIILEPTRELASQTYSEFCKYAGDQIKCGHFSDEHLVSNVDVLVSTPNRIVFHLGQINLDNLRWLVVDESDRLFEVVEGQERCFRNQLAAIYKACEAQCTRVAFFSATFSHEVEKWCKENIENIGMVCIGERNSSNTSVKQELKYCGSEDGKKIAIKTLLKTQFKPPALVFVQSKDRAVQLVKLLSAIDSTLKVDSITSEKSDKERDLTMERFRKGDTWVLVCTELLGRGLDLSDVGLVINYDLPTSIVSYIHRVGRTGRAGNIGHAVTYFTDNDIQYIKSIATVIKQSGFEIPEYLLEMKKVSRDKKKELQRHAPKRHKIAVVKEQMARSRSRSRERRRRSRSRSVERRRTRSRSVEKRRDRSRSRDRRKRSVSRDRDRRHRDERDRRSRSRSPRDRKDRSRSRDRDRKDRKREKKAKKQEISLDSLVGAEEEMMKMMGFGGFDTTKNKQVDDNVDGCVNIKKPRKYRQYMNRKGGFNRPLDYIA